MIDEHHGVILFVIFFFSILESKKEIFLFDVIHHSFASKKKLHVLFVNILFYAYIT